MNKLLLSLTFDDGWFSQYENAFPILEKHDLVATFYIVTSFLSKKYPLYMNPEHVVKISEYHEIGSHSVTHPSLPFCFWKNKKNEIAHSKKVLESLIGKPVESFAYPYGCFNSKIVKLVVASGYKSARSTGERFRGPFAGFNSGKDSIFEIRCKSVKSDTTLSEVRDWFDIAQRNNFWLVLNFHQIIQKPYKWGCTPQMLEDICTLIKSYKCNLVKISEVQKLFNHQKTTPF